MRDLAGRIAVVTGGGSGIGRELARQLVAERCNVAICDLSNSNMTQTKLLCETGLPYQKPRITTHVADVSDELQVRRICKEVSAQHNTDCIHLLFNNAGITGGGSMIKSSRAEWDRTFNVCWNGVYYSTRTFLPMLLKADIGHIVNMSSVAGFWAAAGARTPHTAYAAAKFAVKGFTEALIVDFRENAPHIRCSVVMPGHIGTPIVANTRRILRDTHAGHQPERCLMPADLERLDYNVGATMDNGVRPISDELDDEYITRAPLNAAQAAAIIIGGVKADHWRILIGDDAKQLDKRVRARPERAYDISFFARFERRMKNPAVRLRRVFTRWKWSRRYRP